MTTDNEQTSSAQVGDFNMTDTGTFSFGEAIARMKKGGCVARSGWNGKGMHIYMEDHMSWPVPRLNKNNVVYGKAREYAPCLVLYTAQGIHQPGWNASTPDVLAEDWSEVTGND